MKIRQSKTGVLIAGMYVLLASALSSPLLREGYIGHGNGFVFLLATALTSPLSLILLLVNDVFSDVNAFHMTGWPYLITMCELGAGAVLNAGVMYLVVAFIQRKWQRGSSGGGRQRHATSQRHAPDRVSAGLSSRDLAFITRNARRVMPGVRPWACASRRNSPPR